MAVLVYALPASAGHPEDFARALKECRKGRAAAAEQVFMDRNQGRDRLLNLYEAAGLGRLTGEYRRSMLLFGQADRVAREQELRPVLTAGDALGQGGAVLANDSVLPWTGAPFDKILARTLNALNYLALGDLEGALVEVRKAEEYQALAREQARRAGAAEPGAMADPAVAARCRDMAAFTRTVRNSYENAFTYFLGSQAHLARGRDGLDDARVDLDRALELAPEAPCLREARLELDTRQGKPSGTVVVVYEAGLVPAPAEAAVNLLDDQDRLFRVALPVYQDFGAAEAPLRIQAAAGAWATARLVDIRPLAVKSLQERLPGILVRALAGAAARMEAQEAAERNFGLLGRLTATFATAAVARADRRAWLSLPAEVQVARFALAPGRTELTLAGAGWTQAVPVEVRSGGITFLSVRAVPGCRSVHAATFGAGS